MSVKERTDIFVELRCPVGPRALLAKIVQQGDTVKRTSENLLELSCRDCTRTVRKTNPDAVRVVHRYDVLGQLVESVIQE